MKFMKSTSPPGAAAKAAAVALLFLAVQVAAGSGVLVAMSSASSDLTGTVVQVILAGIFAAGPGHLGRRGHSLCRRPRVAPSGEVIGAPPCIILFP